LCDGAVAKRNRLDAVREAALFAAMGVHRQAPVAWDESLGELGGAFKRLLGALVFVDQRKRVGDLDLSCGC